MALVLTIQERRSLNFTLNRETSMELLMSEIMYWLDQDQSHYYVPLHILAYTCVIKMV